MTRVPHGRQRDIYVDRSAGANCIECGTPLDFRRTLMHGGAPNHTRRPAASVAPSPGTAKARAFCFGRPSTSLLGRATNWRHDVRESARPRLLVWQGSVMPSFLLSNPNHTEVSHV